MADVPDVFPCLTPYFTVQDADEFIKFACKVFGAIDFKENRYEDGTVQHTRLAIGDSMLMVNQSTDQYAPNKSQMHLYVDDVEKTYGVAMENGAKSLMLPMIRPHGDRMAGFHDPQGNIWWVASVGQG